MKNAKPWVGALKIAPHEYQNWATQVPASQLTFWCLEKEKISTTKYLTWAREHYGLAVIKDSFFQEPANLEFWNVIKSVSNWSSSLVPLTEWDGVVFLGCVEPPSEVNWSFPVRYLLASSENLKKYWEQLESPESMQARRIVKAPTAVPVAVPDVASSEPAIPPKFELNLVDAPETPPEIPATPAAAAPEMPDGFNLNLNIPSSSSGAPSGDMFASLKLDLPEEKPNDDSLIQLQEDTSLNLQATNPQIKLEITPDRPEPVERATPTAAQKTPETQVTKPTSSMVIVGGTESMGRDSKTEVPHHLDAVSESKVARMEGSAKNFKAFMEEPEAQEPTSTGHTFTGSFAGPRIDSPAESVIDIKKLAPGDIADASTENEAVAWAFKKLKDHFNQSMILLFEGHGVRPWKWEKSWAPRSEDALKLFDLGSPGIFRIVKRTNLPYHGHVVPSDANQQFFLNWGLANLPAHASVLPMCVGDQPIGLLLCLGEVSANNQQALIFADRVGGKLTERLSRFTAKAA